VGQAGELKESATELGQTPMPMNRCSTGTLLFLMAIGSMAPISSALAQQWLGLKNDMIVTTYVPPASSRLGATRDFLQKRQVLEELSALLSPLRLPYKLPIRTVECGKINAYYVHNDGIFLCYELPAFLSRAAPRIKAPEGMTAQDVAVGAFVQLALHETGHAVFDMLHVPVFGREEDAADQIAAFVMLNFGKDFARQILGGSAQFYRAIDAPMSGTAYADEHGTNLQRFYNLLCIAYGGQPATFRDFVAAGALPKERAANCAHEYEQVKNAFTETIWPHVDQDLLVKVQSIEWAKWEGEYPSEPDHTLLMISILTVFSILCLLVLNKLGYLRHKGRTQASAAEIGKEKPSFGWTNFPMLALAIISIEPCVIAAIAYLLPSIFGLPLGLEIRFELESLMVYPLLIAGSNWPFVALWIICRWKAKKEWPSIGSVRLAMWISLAAMAVPNIPILIFAPFAMLASDAAGGAQTLAFYLAAFVIFPVPILGLIGWFSGRLIARVRRRHVAASAH